MNICIGLGHSAVKADRELVRKRDIAQQLGLDHIDPPPNDIAEDTPIQPPSPRHLTAERGSLSLNGVELIQCVHLVDGAELRAEKSSNQSQIDPAANLHELISTARRAPQAALSIP